MPFEARRLVRPVITRRVGLQFRPRSPSWISPSGPDKESTHAAFDGKSREPVRLDSPVPVPGCPASGSPPGNPLDIEKSLVADGHSTEAGDAD